MKKLFEAISVTAELMGQTISPNASAVMGADLKDYPRDVVFEALKNVRHAGGRFSIGVVITEIDRLQPDGRPGAEEAWAMVPKDEYASAVITDEMAEAMNSAMPLLYDWDKVGARMAFKESYTRLVDASKRAGVPVRWFPYLGHDKESRAPALAEAVRLGRIGQEHAIGLLPPDQVEPMLQIAGVKPLALENKYSVTPEKARENLARMKLMLGNSKLLSN